MQRRKGKKGKRRRQPERWREKERAGYGGREGKRRRQPERVVIVINLQILIELSNYVQTILLVVEKLV